MSTRCHIGFYENDEKNLDNFKALLYRHSDGYPDTKHGVLEAIVPFLEWFSKSRGIDDIEYCSARLLQFLCNRYDRHNVEFRREQVANNNVPVLPRVIEGYKKEADEIEKWTGTLGYGISNQIHGDIDYFYAVRPQSLEVYSVSYGDLPQSEKYHLEQTISII